jgi:N4-gp56 family major capsid protein
MSRTIVGLNDPKAVKRYSAFLAVDTARVSYFNRKFMGVGPDSGMPIQMLPQLENDAGELITYDLSMQLRQQPIEGDDKQEGTEEALKFFTDSLYIDQMRGGVNTGGRMTRKRTIHDLRKIARKRQSEWWGRVFDELWFMYLSGARGSNTEFIFPTTYTGFANNAFAAADAEHRLYGGDASSFATISNNDQMTLALVDKAKVRAEMMGGGTQGTPQIQPIMINGEEHYVLVMSPWQEYDVRTSTSTGHWLDIQKAAAGAEGRNNPIFKGNLGMYNNVVLHAHKGVIRFTNAGSDSLQPAARALFLGAQAGQCAFGSPGTGLRFDWHEETRDNGNEVVISTSSIFGCKKTRFTIDGTAKDFGVIACDTYSTNPAPVT